MRADGDRAKDLLTLTLGDGESRRVDRNARRRSRLAVRQDDEGADWYVEVAAAHRRRFATQRDIHRVDQRIAGRHKRGEAAENDSDRGGRDRRGDDARTKGHVARSA